VAGSSSAPADPSSVSGGGDSVVAKVAAVWDRLLRDCGDLGQVELMSALTACRLGSDGDTLVISVPDHRDTACLRDEPEALRPLVERALGVHLGEPITVRFAADGGGRLGRYRRAEGHPVVKRLMELFDAEILAYEPMDRTTWERHVGGGEEPDKD
jgi:hypothetical protein